MTLLDAGLVVLKATVPVLIALTFARTRGRRHPEIAHLGLSLAFAAALLLPLVSALLPQWRVPLLASHVPTTASLSSGEAQMKGLGSRQPSHVALPPQAVSAPRPTSVAPFQQEEPKPAIGDPSLVLLTVWLFGAGVLTLRTILGGLTLRRLRRGSTPMAASSDLTSRVGLRRPWELRRCLPGGRASALTWGTFRPIVLLPAESAGWSPARMESVLLHELTHVRRGDALASLVAELACAVYWFNPLMWLGAHVLRESAEHSADRAVLRGGVRPSDYAADLLALAAGPRRSSRLVGVQAMNSPKIESRLRAILAADLSARVPSKRMTLLVTLAALAAVPALGAFRPVSTQERSAQDQDEAAQRAKALAIGTLMYAGDYDDILPFGDSTSEVSAKVLPYTKPYLRDRLPHVKGTELFQSPTPGGRFLFNTHLSGTSPMFIGSPAETPAWYESLPDPAMSFAVAYVDGHVKIVSPAERAGFQKAWAKKYPRGVKVVHLDTGLATPAPTPSPAERLVLAKARLAAAKAESERAIADYVRTQKEAMDLLKSSQSGHADGGVRRLESATDQKARAQSIKAALERMEKEAHIARMRADRANRKALEATVKAIEAEKKARAAAKRKP